MKKNGLQTVEKWLDIENYKGYYQVSSDGRVKSLKRTRIGISNIPVAVNERVLIPKEDNYKRVVLSKNKNKKTFSIHRLVAKAFIFNPKNKPQVNHKDGDKLNNNISNLEWVTASENHIHAHKIGLKKPNITGLLKFNNGHSTGKKVKQLDINGNIIAVFESGHNASKITKIAQSSIWKSCEESHRTAGGYKWRFI